MNRINVVKNDVYTQAYPVFDLCMKSNQEENCILHAY
jgi:hypothetical protein